MNRIVIFKGAKRDFEKILTQENINSGNYTPFMELIRQYNVTVRASETDASQYSPEFSQIALNNVVIYSDDFASVTDHVITNFNNIVILGHNIDTLYVQNPPKRVEMSLKVKFSDIIEEKYSEYKHIDSRDINDFYKYLIDSEIVGQEDAKKQICISFLKKSVMNKNSPLVLMLYGPSGVGKTELSKIISKYFSGRITRIQFSMMQTEESVKYIFGDSHGKASLAKDLLSRETNIVLIDEFDKVNRNLYNAFYQAFDEGIFEDINYEVDISECVFLLTTNYINENEILKNIGYPLFSRIDRNICFNKLSYKELEDIIKKIYKNVISKLDKNQQKLVDESELLTIYINSLNKFDNIRSIYNYIEYDVMNIIFESLLH